MATGDAPEQATETVYAAVDWNDYRTGTEIKRGDSVDDVPLVVADWLVRAGVVTREAPAEDAPPSSEEPKDKVSHHRQRKD